jgi:surface antigen
MRRFVGSIIIAVGAVLAGLDVTPASARRVALVVGNADYKIGPLQNPVNDAAAVAGTLEQQLRFEKVMLRTNLNASGFRAALLELARESAGADLGLVYFAGHGTEVGGKNFLIPVDATLARSNALAIEAIPLDAVLEQLDGVRRLKLVILDACRNNVFGLAGAKRAVGRGLARIEPEDNTLIAYAAKEGTTADDGKGRHSPYTMALLRHIATPGLEINLLFRRVRTDVLAATGGGQQPAEYHSLGDKEIFLVPPLPYSGGTVHAPPPVPVSPPSDVVRTWAAVKDTTSIAALEAFRRQYGSANPVYDRLAEARIVELRKEQTALAAPTPKKIPEGARPNISPCGPTSGGPTSTDTIGGSIGRDLNARDRELARQAEYNAWERGTPGRPVRWCNPNSGRGGEVVPEAYFERGGSRCRDFIHTVWIDGRRRQMRGTACRNPDGTWTQVG